MSDTKLYLTTDLAGLHVAGRRLAFTIDRETGQPQPIPDQELRLTDAEAKYELANGVIRLAEDQGDAAENKAPPAPTAKAPPAPAAKAKG